MSRISDEYHNKLQAAADRYKVAGLNYQQSMGKLKKDYPKSNHKQRRGVVRHAFGLAQNGKDKAA
tara:strand:+ start:3750 stop:3944 length:195 start_codon:yes stop_codon:yes gene_type:complete